MEDRIGDEKTEYLVELYGEIREKFYNADSGTYDPNQENRHFVMETLGISDDAAGFPNLVEGADLFFGYVHTLFTIRTGESFANWEGAKGLLHDFVYGEDSDDDDWIEPFKTALITWIENLNVEVEIPY